MSPARHRRIRRGARGQLTFLVAGVQKGGTTSLYRLLVQHPQIARPQAKELHFFDDESIDWAHVDYRSYHARITWPDSAKVAGEYTPSYIFWPGALERIHAYNPRMRLVLSFRDPIERAFSQWCMTMERRGDIPRFGDALRALMPTQWPRTAAEAVSRTFAIVGRGYYSEQLGRAHELFTPEHALVLDYHVLFQDLRASLDRITDFIGIDRFEDVPAPVHRRSQPKAIDSAPPTEADVALLVDLYRDDLGVFAQRSGLDVSGWPTAQVIAGELTAAELAARLAAKAVFSTSVDVSPSNPA